MTGMTEDEIRGILTYKTPTPSKRALHEIVNQSVLDLGLRLGAMLGESPLARELVVRVSDVRMMANLAIAQMSDDEAERAAEAITKDQTGG